jgi:hypothetical protein
MRALITGEVPAPVVAVALTEDAPRIFSVPTPRAAAVAITGILAFGVMLGSVVSPTAQSQAQSPLIVAVSPPAAPAAAPAPASAPAAEQTVDEVPVDEAPAEAPVQQTVTVYENAPTDTTPTGPAPRAPLPIPPLPPLPSVSHVFVVMLSGHGYEAAFGANSQASYLSKTLTTHGELIPNYYGIAHGELANSIALISGQGPTEDARRPTVPRRQHMEGLRRGRGQQWLRPQRHGVHAVAQPVHLLPLAGRQPDAVQLERGRPRPASDRPRSGRRHPRALLHSPEPLP